MLRWYSACADLRRRVLPAGATRLSDSGATFDEDDRWFVLARRPADGPAYAVVANLGGRERSVPVEGAGHVLLEWAPGTAAESSAVRLPGWCTAVVTLREA
jgi:hypothetical protein